MRLGLPTFVIFVVLCANYIAPYNAYPSDGDAESEASGHEDSASKVRNLLQGEPINEEYDIVHTVVIDPIVEDNDNNDTDDDTDDESIEEDNEFDDDDQSSLNDEPPYKKYKKWRGWRKHPLYVVILGG